MNDKTLSDQAHWDSFHTRAAEADAPYSPDSFSGFRNRTQEKIFEQMQRFYTGGRILEIGAGSSDWLIKIASDMRHDGCVGLDYSPRGCELLLRKAKVAGVEVSAVCADLFKPPPELLNSFDFIYSMGVVEHFSALSEVLTAFKQYAKSGAVLFTIIPNMAGVYGMLTKRRAPDIYAIHVPHDLNSFKRGHVDADLDILFADYLCSSNFWMISSCFQGQARNAHRPAYLLYGLLTRFSLLCWWVESLIGDLPTSRQFSPYILVVSRVKTAVQQDTGDGSSKNW